MKARFARKIPNLKALKSFTAWAKEQRPEGLAYTVLREIELSDAEFKTFTEDLLEDQPWLEETDGGMNKAREIRCVRVRNTKTGERILVNSEGYNYPRYTAIEE